jgi:hypothetical protein
MLRVRREPTPPAAAEFVQAALACRGIRRVHRKGDGRLQVISVSAGLTIWVGETVYWRDGNGGYTHHRLSDLCDAIEHIVAHHEVLAQSRTAGRIVDAEKRALTSSAPSSEPLS